MAIFPRGTDPKDPDVVSMREKIASVNAELKKMDDGKQTRYLDIGEKLLAPDGTLPKSIMPDGLHLNHDGYEIWAKALQPMLEEVMK